MEKYPGVFTGKKKDGTIYYRSSFTYKSKHISLGSYDTILQAKKAYEEATMLVNSDATILDYNNQIHTLLFAKWISIINFRDNGIYIKTPIYLRNKQFMYYFDRHDYYIFDVDDLFYYSEHTITRRGGHLFVNEYGMQVNIASRYGIMNHAVCGRDYEFVNGNTRDYRYSNIRIINRYYGVRQHEKNGNIYYTSRIHINGDYIIGYYDDEIIAAIAYNKAADYINTMGYNKSFRKNYIEEMSSSEYLSIYKDIKIPKNIQKYCRNM
ncbi:MAG: hypothetical protein E7265_10560 [Lachnospiraceae bacterium]|nr:hypothetical protein [Lachnospiraceae bacterium]